MISDFIDHLGETELERLFQLYRPIDAIDGLRVSSWNSKEPLREAAVLVPFLRQNDGWHLLYIHRSDQVADHKGQVAFPGGGYEPGDRSPIETALRETEEEIGVDPNQVKVLGQIDRLMTGTGYIITPVIGLMPWPYPFRLSLDEVDTVFTIPLAWLADPKNREEKPHQIFGEQVKVIYYKPYQGEILWGASARITTNLLKILDIK